MRGPIHRIHTSHTSDLTTHRNWSGPWGNSARIVIAVDLSAVIFVVLALAWAVYLIPKALKHHDEMASERLVEGHSERVRVLRRKQLHVEASVVVDEVEVEPTPVSTAAPVAPVVSYALTTRTAARAAARRRRRVLGVLVLATAVVAGLAAFAIVPWWSTAVPGGLILLFLVVARFSVRSAQRASLAQRRPAPVPVVAAETVELAEVAEPAEAAVSFVAAEPREELEAVLADDGSLWDPLPVTLPTYVNKARARRTVRTIELTNVASSGHSEADSTLAREADEARVAEQSAASEAEQRKAAGA
jgi:hypothetical protein